VLNEILQSTENNDPRFTELRNFCKFIVRRLYEGIEARGPEVVAVESLFPKTRKTASLYLAKPPADYLGFIAGDDEEEEAWEGGERGEEEEEEGHRTPNRKNRERPQVLEAEEGTLE
jgi:hypothetical protein